jgi:hypothetical protein
LSSGTPPALINSFAKVVIEGPQPQAIYPIPSTAMRGGERIWLLEPRSEGGGTLVIVPAELVHVDGETSYVRAEGIPDGARLITTALSTPQAGMQLRDVIDTNQAAENQTEASE